MGAGDLVERAYVPTRAHAHPLLRRHPDARPVQANPAQYPSFRPVGPGDACRGASAPSGPPRQVLRTFAVGRPDPLYSERTGGRGGLRRGGRHAARRHHPAEIRAAAGFIEDAGFPPRRPRPRLRRRLLPPVLGSASRDHDPGGAVPVRAGMTVVVQPNVVTRDGSAGVQCGELVHVTATARTPAPRPARPDPCRPDPGAGADPRVATAFGHWSGRMWPTACRSPTSKRCGGRSAAGRTCAPRGRRGRGSTRTPRRRGRRPGTCARPVSTGRGRGLLPLRHLPVFDDEGAARAGAAAGWPAAPALPPSPAVRARGGAVRGQACRQLRGRRRRSRARGGHGDGRDSAKEEMSAHEADFSPAAWPPSPLTAPARARSSPRCRPADYEVPSRRCDHLAGDRARPRSRRPVGREPRRLLARARRLRAPRSRLLSLSGPFDSARPGRPARPHQGGVPPRSMWPPRMRHGCRPRLDPRASGGITCPLLVVSGGATACSAPATPPAWSPRPAARSTTSPSPRAPRGEQPPPPLPPPDRRLARRPPP